MNDLTCIVVGCGHAGLQALHAIKETTRGMAGGGRRIRLQSLFAVVGEPPHDLLP